MLLAPTLRPEDSPGNIESGDVNGDGVLDLIVANEGTTDNVSVLIGDGAGGFAAAVNYSAGQDVGSVSIGDINNDGVVDILTSDTTDNTLSILEGRTKSVAAVSDVNLTTAESSQNLVEILDSTLSTIIEQRSDLGNINTSLETSQNFAFAQQESLGSALSTIQDTDFAIETAELVRNQVLQQAQVAVAAQANTQLQVVLGLLQF